MAGIFISSTSYGLKSYRMIATEIVAAQGYTPVVEEHFRLPQDSMMLEIKDKITRCQGVIALVGPYYGARSTWNRGNTPMSYSQYELVFARQIKRPCLILLAAPGLPLSREAAEEPADLARFQRAFGDEIRANKHGGWTTFGDRFEFALALAKHRWEEWLDGR